MQEHIMSSSIEGTNGRFEFRKYNNILNKLVYDTDRCGYNIRSIGSCLELSPDVISKLDKWGANGHSKIVFNMLKSQYDNNVVYSVSNGRSKKGANLPAIVLGKYVHESAIEAIACDISPDYLVKHTKRTKDMLDSMETSVDDGDISVASNMPTTEDITSISDSIDKLLYRIRRMEHKQDSIMQTVGAKRNQNRNDRRNNDKRKPNDSTQKRHDNRREKHETGSEEEDA